MSPMVVVVVVDGGGWVGGLQVIRIEKDGSEGTCLDFVINMVDAWMQVTLTQLVENLVSAAVHSGSWKPHV